MIEQMVAKKTFTYEEVLKVALAYFTGDELAATTWMNKYAIKDKKGNFLEQSPEDMHKRMAKEYTVFSESAATCVTKADKQAKTATSVAFSQSSAPAFFSCAFQLEQNQ